MYDILQSLGINTLSLAIMIAGFISMLWVIRSLSWVMAQLRRSRDRAQATDVLKLEDLSSELETVNTNWYKLGVYLGLDTHKLMQIERDHQGSERQMLQMLHIWLQCTPNAVWRDVVSALQKMGENRVAESICQKYMRGASKL